MKQSHMGPSAAWQCCPTRDAVSSPSITTHSYAHRSCILGAPHTLHPIIPVPISSPGHGESTLPRPPAGKPPSAVPYFPPPKQPSLTRL